jgi:RNA polymerase sigma factor (sigma-70 family)
MPKFSNLSETSLWHAFVEGDRLAFEQVLNEYYPMLLRYGKRLAPHSDLAQDCLQDFFVDLWQRRQQLGLPENLKAYLLASYRRYLLRNGKRSFWQRQVVDINDTHDIDVQFSIETYLINNEVEHETLLKLRQQLATLSKRQREAMYLRFTQELEYTEIAKIMNIAQHSVVNLVYEAIKMLRKNWVL